MKPAIAIGRAKPPLAVLLLLVLARPGTAAAGSPHRYLSRQDDWFATEEAKRIAANILSYQADAGGWPKNIDTTAPPSRAIARL